MPGVNLPSSWSAQWIGPLEVDPAPSWRPAHHIVGEFTVDGEVAEARLIFTAHGVVEPFLNGTRVGDQELLPGFTAYRERLQVFEVDVTDHVIAGGNALGFLLSDGWWRGQTTVARKSNRYGSTVEVFAELHLTYADGTTQTVVTDDSWLSTTGHIVAADLMAGEHHDLNLEVAGWSEAGTDRSTWSPVEVRGDDTSTFVAPLAPPVRRLEELTPVDVRRLEDGRHIVDFGRTTNGWIRLSDLGPAGTRLTIEYTEALSPDGTGAQNGCHQSDYSENGTPFQTDIVVSAGDGRTFEPRHSTKGFRYVVIDGHPGRLVASDLVGVTVRNDLVRLGDFTCSNEDLNKLHRAAEWSLLTNCCDIPTDCPTRERAGWTGDWQIFVDTAAFLYDVEGFSRKWLLDMKADQLENGAICNFIPEPADFREPDVHWWRDLQGSAGWGDAVVHVPWELYRATGDTGVLSELYPAMVKWVEFARERAATDRHPDRVAARPVPAEHETYLWDSGFHFGEWNEPGAEEEQIERIRVMDHGPTATAYLFRSASELAQIAALLGHESDATTYQALADNACRAWREEFLGDNGEVEPLTQANLVRGLAFGLIPEENRKAASQALVELVEKSGMHLGTGFLSTPFLLPVLADNGHAQTAFEVLFQRSFPSWLGMLDAGATTIWEGWDSMKPDGTVTSSLNHFSMGAVISFLHRYVAGLSMLEPGYRRFRVRPTPHRDISSANVRHVSPHGEISVAWELDALGGLLRLTVPAGTEAEVQLPDGSEASLAAGQHEVTW